jgi:hypothetical protein
MSIGWPFDELKSGNLKLEIGLVSYVILPDLF